MHSDGVYSNNNSHKNEVIVDYVAGCLFDEDILLASKDGANLLMRSTPIAFSVSGKIYFDINVHLCYNENGLWNRFFYFAMCVEEVRWSEIT